MIDPARPLRLAPRARLRTDRATGRPLLLWPERGLVLGPTAAEVVALLDGARTVSGVVDALVARRPGVARDVVERDVAAFLEALAARALLG